MACKKDLFSQDNSSFILYENHRATFVDKFNSGNRSFDDLLARCWPHNDCGDCLEQDVCSWCPMTSSCVPNLSLVHILAPIRNADVCPLWSERWELRTQFLGCSVSTLTFLTCVLTILSTLAAFGLIVGIVSLSRLIGRRWRARSPGWDRPWKIWRRRSESQGGNQDEERPLLE